jgi:hypothetical protein
MEKRSEVEESKMEKDSQTEKKIEYVKYCTYWQNLTLL